MSIMAKPYPEEFRRDVVAVARRGEIPLHQVAKDFGISEGTVTNWLRRADVDDGVKRGVTTVRTWSCENCGNGTGYSSRRTRSSAVLPRISPKPISQNDVPAGP
jgi:transposase-like protein